MAREALEVALQAQWNPDELEVYADHLLAENHPRGELIALDRRPAPDDVSWRERRHTALVRWLGDERAVRYGHLVQHGFVHELRCSKHAPELLDEELGTLVRGYTCWGTHPRLGAALARLASKPRPWLKRLVIAYWGSRPYPQELAAELARATPNLEELHLIGRPPFHAIAHPGVKRIVLDQAMAIELPEVPRERRTSREWSTGWPVSAEDLELVQQVVRDLPDCNLLYDWYAEAFGEPMPALLARVASAGLIELDGPIARPPRDLIRDAHAEIYDQRQLHVDVSVAPEVLLGPLAEHARLVSTGLYECRMPQVVRGALEDYVRLLNTLGHWQPPAEDRRRVLKSLVPNVALGFDLLLERRALLDEVRTGPIIALEVFAGLLALPGAHRRVTLRI
jgi:hypothetical protein